MRTQTKSEKSFSLFFFQHPVQTFYIGTHFRDNELDDHVFCGSQYSQNDHDVVQDGNKTDRKEANKKSGLYISADLCGIQMKTGYCFKFYKGQDNRSYQESYENYKTDYMRHKILSFEHQ